jgi:hypothetical protein
MLELMFANDRQQEHRGSAWFASPIASEAGDASRPFDRPGRRLREVAAPRCRGEIWCASSRFLFTIPG